MKRTEKTGNAELRESRNKSGGAQGPAGAQGQSKAQVNAQAIVEQIAEAVAVRAGLELVEVELKGAGRNQLLRITIDKPAASRGADGKPESVTHTDCETMSREVSEALDADDPISGTYQLEVTSPGVERKLKKWQDWERFQGEKAKIVLKEPVGELKHFDGVIAGTSEDRSITVELADGSSVTFPFEQIDRANLRFEW
jgi:ribosome maturation factor RimP